MSGNLDECHHGTRLTLHCRQCEDAISRPALAPDDIINHPAHYMAGGLESITVIEAYALGYRLGNCIKYILRCGRKGDPIEDLKKARWYLDREIARRTHDQH